MIETKIRELKKSLMECVDRGGEALKAFPWENSHAYGFWLAQTYYFVRHTTSFISLTASRFGHWQREKQYHQIRHLREEAGHDVLLLEDLKNLGFKIQDFPELPETAALYQMQYYFIEHENPASHFGYAQFLEGLAAKKIGLFYKRAETSFSPQACVFLRTHMVEDQLHFEKGLENLNSLNETEIDSFYRNLQQTSRLYTLILDHIKKLTQ